MNEFNYRSIGWQCTCGCPRSHVKIGITSQGELCAIWKCGRCGKDVMARMKLEDLIRDIPPPPDGVPLRPPLQITAPQCTDADLKLLGEAHIKWD